jgi:hypothetical protein
LRRHAPGLRTFRHFFVSTLANANVAPFKVMKIVGHSSLDILTYHHVREEELLSAVDGADFGAVLDEASEEKRNEKQSASSAPTVLS